MATNNINGPMMAAPPADRNQGVTITIPAGHSLLADMVDTAGRATDLLTQLVATLSTDPVDLLELRRLVALEINDVAEELELDLDSMLIEVMPT